MAWLLNAAVVLLSFLVLVVFRRKVSGVGDGKLNVAFVHPDLGIGGAERLIVDAAVGLQKLGHRITVYTAHHDRSHCFEETRDGTLRVVSYGDRLPKRIRGRCYAACAYARMCYAALRMAASGEFWDVIIVDQVSVCVPLLRLALPRGIAFYCHFPDKLLCARRGASLLKRAYRAPLDFLEEETTGWADVVLVNSKFTAETFAAAFPRLHRRGVAPEILYPALNLGDADAAAAEADADPDLDGVADDDVVLLSINRFERKKNVNLAVEAFAALPEATRRKAVLVLAGGYDERLPENVEHAAELEAVARDRGVGGRVLQRRNVSAGDKARLLRRAACLLYTPENEHFGIVPLEAMYARTPVLACDSGGPLETVVDGATGFLRPPDPAAWAEAIAALLDDPDGRAAMGANGRARVAADFSLSAFANSLHATITALAQRR